MNSSEAPTLTDRLGPSPFTFLPQRESMDPAMAADALQEHLPLLKTYGAEPQTPVHAYAKLEGPEFTYFLRKLQVMIGRKVQPTDAVDVHLGNFKSISRQHARIQFNFMTGKFELAIYGKNGAWVDDRHVPCNARPVSLDHGTKIRIGEVELFFILPRMENTPVIPLQMQEHKMARAAPAVDSDEQPASKKQRRAPRPSDLDPASFQAMPARLAMYGMQVSPNGNLESAKPRKKPGARGSITGQPLPNGDIPVRPPLSYAALIAEAINSTPEGRITLKDMYGYISNKYPFYGMDSPGWQNCLRHTLSLHKAFVKKRRTDRGKGAWWSLDPDHEHLISPSSRRMREYEQQTDFDNVGQPNPDALEDTSDDGQDQQSPSTALTSVPLPLDMDGHEQPQFHMPAYVPMDANNFAHAVKNEQSPMQASFPENDQ
ncbi:transcription factor [Rhizophlyctis rosea]|nr:transcription factor [Rhizophlyctis rosea]